MPSPATDPAALPSPDAVERAVRAADVDGLLAWLDEAEGVADRRWLRDALARALRLADPGALTAAQREAARRAGAPRALVGEDGRGAPPHAVRLPLVEVAAGVGLVRTVWIGFRPAGQGGRGAVALDDRARRAVAEALALAAQRRRPPHPVRWYELEAARPEAFAGTRIEGPSVAAAAYVSALSLWSGRAVRPGTVVTGAIDRGRLVPVGGVEAKRAAAARSRRPDCRRLLAPPAPGAAPGVAEPRAELRATPRLVHVADLEALAREALVPTPTSARDAEHEVEHARRAFIHGWDGFRWAAERERLERLAGTLPAARLDLRVEVLALLGGALRNMGDPDASLRVLARADELARSREGKRTVPDLPLALLAQHRALTLRQLGRFGPAARAARAAVDVARRARLLGEQMKAHGCAGFVALSRGRVAEAIRHQQAARDIALSFRPSAAPRSSAYLVDALGVAGDTARARRVYRKALDEVRRGAAGASRDGREAWLRVAYGRACVLAGRRADAVRVLDVPPVREAIVRDPMPGLQARRWLGLALASRDPERGFGLLATSPSAYVGGEHPFLVLLAHLNVLVEARARLFRGAYVEDTRERALAATRAIGDGPGRFLGRPRARLEAALERPAQAARIARELDRYVTQAERIA